MLTGVAVDICLARAQIPSAMYLYPFPFGASPRTGPPPKEAVALPDEDEEPSSDNEEAATVEVDAPLDVVEPSVLKEAVASSFPPAEVAAPSVKEDPPSLPDEPPHAVRQTRRAVRPPQRRPSPLGRCGGRGT